MMTTAAASRSPCRGGATEWRLQPAEFFAATDVLSSLKSSALNFSQHPLSLSLPVRVSMHAMLCSLITLSLAAS